MNSASKLAYALANLIVAPSRLLPSDWCQKNIRLPEGVNETEPGPIDWSSRPYLREPLDRLVDPRATDIIFVAPTRDGKTFLLRMAWTYSIAGDPCATLWYDQNEAKGRGISIKELQPLVRHNRVLSERKPANHHHFTNQLMMFLGAPFLIYGASTAGQAAGDTAKRVLGNEVDKWGDASDKEASLVELVRHRTESFDDERCHMFSSTPTLETGPIWQNYLAGDQRTWRARCPDCTNFHALIWDNVHWSPESKISDHQWDLQEVKRTARYRCPDCGSQWDDRMRRLAVQHPDAHWAPSNEKGATPGYYSYHINGLHGPKEKNNVGALAIDFLAARHTAFYTNRQDFWNSRMGLPWKDDISQLTAEKFAARETSCIRGDIPEGFALDVLIIGFDVQTYGLPYVVEGYSWTGRYHTIDHGLAPSWSDIEGVQRHYIEKFKVKSYTIGDINYEDRRPETLEQIFIRSHLGWIGAEAFEKTKDLVRLEKINPFLGGRRQRENLFVKKLLISSYDFKVELEKDISGEMKNWTTYQLPIAASDSEIRDQRDFYDQLMDERRVPRKRRVAGKPPFEFKSRNGNNHAFDCKVYAKALYFLLSRARAYGGGRQSAVPAERKTYEIKQT